MTVRNEPCNDEDICRTLLTLLGCSKVCTKTSIELSHFFCYALHFLAFEQYELCHDMFGLGILKSFEHRCAGLWV